MAAASRELDLELLQESVVASQQRLNSMEATISQLSDNLKVWQCSCNLQLTPAELTAATAGTSWVEPSRGHCHACPSAAVSGELQHVSVSVNTDTKLQFCVDTLTGFRNTQEFQAVLGSLQQVLALMAAQSRPQPAARSAGHRWPPPAAQDSLHASI